MGGFVWISSFVICSIYVMNYAKKVQKNPQLSLMSEGEKKIGCEEYGNTEAVIEPPTTEVAGFLLR